MTNKKDALRNGEKDREDPIKSFFDPAYKEEVDAGKGIREGSKARKELEKYPLAGPLVDALLGGFDTMGKSKDYERTYNQVKHGESPRKVFGDEIRKSKKQNAMPQREHRDTHFLGKDNDRSYTTRDKYSDRSSNYYSEKEGVFDKILTWTLATIFYSIIAVPIIAGFTIGFSEKARNYINSYQNKSRISLHKINSGYEDRTLNYDWGQAKTLTLEERVKTGLKKWIGENRNLMSENGSYFFSFQDRDYEFVEKHIWAVGSLSSSGANGRVLHSSDEGKTWEVQWRSGDYGADPFDVEFLNEYEGYIATNKSILHTIDGGNNWRFLQPLSLVRWSYGGRKLRSYIEKGDFEKLSH